ncbi:MAG: oxidoreductase domain protein [Paenibacillaceae bacterium]|nr:oxidoreductase domain protein [Paenibacillaceae bacterium]
MKKLGMGVIGLGMGRNMLYINRESSFQTEVRALCDKDPATRNGISTTREDVKEEFGIAYTTDNYKDLLKRDDLHIIGIFTPDHLHFEMIKDSLEAGKHVIVTKPMVVSLEEAKETVRLVQKYDRKLLVGQTRRYEGNNVEAKKFYDTGKLGKPLLAQAAYVHDMRSVFDRSPWRFQHPKDFLYGGACHPIDQLRWFFGDVDEVSALGTTSCDPRYPHDKEINFMLNLKFKNGVIARVLNVQGIIHPPKGSGGLGGFAICGEKGTLVGSYVRYEEDGVVHDFKLPGEEEMIDFDGKEYSGHTASALRYVREMEASILNNTKPTINEIEGAKCTAVSAAAWESIRTGRAVKVFNEF